MLRLTTLALALFSACSTMSTPASPTSRHFGIDSDDQPATLWTLKNGNIEVDVTDHGATLVAVRAPDRAGITQDIVLGFDDVSGYESDRNQYFGCTTGRVCNRIANGTFDLDGYEYQLAKNNGPNHLHGGGPNSFDKVHWHGEPTSTAGSPAVRFTYMSRDGEEGYPGNLQVCVTYSLLPGGQLQIDYEARTDKRTPINLTNHAYWNLAGEGAETVLDHWLEVDADHYTKTDATLIPTGEIAPVVGTALDFRAGMLLGGNIDPLAETPALGYDHNLVLRSADGAMRRVAELRHQASGRSMLIETTEPSLQVYSGNHLNGQAGKGDKPYPKRSAVCLETQHHPDAVHHQNFPNTVLEPGQLFRSSTRMTFRAK